MTGFIRNSQTKKRTVETLVTSNRSKDEHPIKDVYGYSLPFLIGKIKGLSILSVGKTKRREETKCR